MNGSFCVAALRELEGSLIMMLERIIHAGIHSVGNSIKLQALPTKLKVYNAVV